MKKGLCLFIAAIFLSVCCFCGQHPAVADTYLTIVE